MVNAQTSDTLPGRDLTWEATPRAITVSAGPKSVRLLRQRVTPAYYHSPDWQEGEREAQADINAGRVTEFADHAEAVEHLRNL